MSPKSTPSLESSLPLLSGHDWQPYTLPDLFGNPSGGQPNRSPAMVGGSAKPRLEPREQEHLLTQTTDSLAEDELLLEHNQQRLAASARVEAYAVGYREGRVLGFEEAHRQAFEQAKQAGFAQGHEEGLAQGRVLGQSEAAAQLQAAIEQGREQGQMEGFAQGQALGESAGREAAYAAALAEAQAQSSQQVEHFLQLLRSLDQAIKHVEETVAEQLTTLLIDGVRHMTHPILRLRPDLVLETIRDALSLLPWGSAQARLVVHPDDAALIRQHLAERIRQENWTVVEDPSVDAGGIRLFAQGVEINATLRDRWQRLMENFARREAWK